MEEKNESNEPKKRQISKFIVITVLMLIWVFGIGSLTAKVIEDIELDNEPHHSCGINTEIEGFNSTFTTYGGKQTGSQVKALLQRLKANSITYKEEPSKIPCISYNTSTDTNIKDKLKFMDKTSIGVIDEKETDAYISYINTLSKNLDLKHKYKVVITTNNIGIVSGITINFDEDNSAENFIIAKDKDLSQINGLKGIPELIGGEIKTNSDYLEEIIKKNNNTESNNEKGQVDDE